MPTNHITEQSDAKNSVKNDERTPHRNKSWNDNDKWQCKSQAWNQTGTWWPNNHETYTKPDDDKANLRGWEGDTLHETSHMYNSKQNSIDQIHYIANAQQNVYRFSNTPSL